MSFKIGCVAGPGRPPGSVSGRREALRVLDSVLADSTIQATLETAIRTAFNKNPIAFFKTIVMPLLPQESKVAIAREGPVVWQSLLATFPLPKPLTTTSPSGEKS